MLLKSRGAGFVVAILNGANKHFAKRQSIPCDALNPGGVVEKRGRFHGAGVRIESENLWKACNPRRRAGDPRGVLPQV